MQNGDKAPPRKHSLHNSQKACDLAPLLTLYSISDLAPLLQGYKLLCCVVVPG